jgi:hypothetical protein
MTTPFYEERRYAFDLDEVGSQSMSDLIFEFTPEEPGFELIGHHDTASGHPNINQRLFGNKKLLILNWRKYSG